MTQITLSHYQSNGPKCPECGRSFKTAGGMKRHYAQKHDGSLKGVDVICDGCGDKYTVAPTRVGETRFCSRSCAGGSNKGRRFAERKELECEICGKFFEVYEHEPDRRFCSVDCRGKWQSTITGSDHRSWRGGRGIIESVKSELTPAFPQVRERVRDEECEMCGATPEDVGRELDVHHIIPIRSGGTNGEWNLMTVCPSCHHQIENHCRQFPGFEPILKQEDD